VSVRPLSKQCLKVCLELEHSRYRSRSHGAVNSRSSGHLHVTSNSIKHLQSCVVWIPESQMLKARVARLGTVCALRPSNANATIVQCLWSIVGSGGSTNRLPVAIVSSCHGLLLEGA
jgi:hypothetical protein